jgi:hypothetical protein
MKNLTVLLFFLSATLFAQDPITTNLGDFSELKVFNGLTVKLVKSNTSKIEISGSQANDVSIKNANGVLKVRLKFPESFIAENVKIVLYYNNNIATLDANEGAYIISNEKINQQHLEVKVQEGAKIDLDVNIKYLVVKTVSGGIITLNGSTDNQTIDANTGGIYYGFDLQSKQTTVISAAGSTAEVNTSEILDAKAQFGGSILYKGSPEVLKSKTIVKGTIKSMN